MAIGTQTLNTVEVKFDETYEVRNVLSKDFIRTYVDMHLRVAAYARVSTDSEEQQTSYYSQLTHYETMIKQNKNWEFVGVYADEGISGTQTKKRDNFNRMIQDALDGKIDMIIAKSISRFARNTVDTLNIVRLLRSHNVDVFFEKENIHTLSITNELFLTLYSAFAQGESESISENMKSGLQMKMKRGEYVGNPNCYGYDWIVDTQELVVNEKEAKIVVRIFEEYAKGYGTTIISRRLNEDGIPSPRGKRWKPETIRRILFNEKYLGDLCSGKSFVESVITHKRKINTGQSKQWYTTNRHVAIISKELWDKAHEMYKMRSDKSKKHRDKYSRRYPFSSKIYCGDCGERFVRRSYRKNKNNPNSERVIFWGCRSVFRDEIECTNKLTYKDEELKAMFVFLYNQLYNDKDKYVSSFMDKVDSILNDNNTIKEKTKLEKERECVIAKQSKLIDLSMDEKISKNLLDLKMNELNNQLLNIDNRLNEINDSEKIRDNKTEQLNKIMEVIENKRQLSEFDDEVFESIVDRIIVGETKEDGTFDYHTIKFILKTGETLVGGTGVDILNFALQEENDKYSTYHYSIQKINEDKDTGLTAYMQNKRSGVCWGSCIPRKYK